MSKILECYVEEADQATGYDCTSTSTVARLSEHIKFDDKALNSYSRNGLQAIHQDLLLLCATVEFADKSFKRGYYHCGRQIHISAPVHDPKSWENQHVHDNLRLALRLLTGDDWKFEFRPYKRKRNPDINRENTLFDNPNVKFAMTFTDELDSHCVYEIYGDEETVQKVHVGSDHRLNHKEKQYICVPFTVKPNQIVEHGRRYQSFKFSVVASIFAHLANVNKVVIAENGQSSIGSAILNLHNTIPDYSNHPAFFRLMERLLNGVLHTEIHFEQPRLWYTQGETVQNYRSRKSHIVEYIDALLRTRSCSRKRYYLNFDKHMQQCGICSACLLRRMSLYSAKIEEPQCRFTVSDLTEGTIGSATKGQVHHTTVETLRRIGDVNIKQINDFASLLKAPSTLFEAYAYSLSQSLELTQKEVIFNLKRLIERHADEWNSFVSAQGNRSFLLKWIRSFDYG